MRIEPDDCLEFIRVALTERQCKKHKIPLVEKDDRLVQEAEALPTDVLRAELEAALSATLDMDLFDDVARKKRKEIDELVRKIRRLRASR